jgi:hydrogenase maturation protease
VVSKKKTKGYSLHEFDLISFLRFARSFREIRKIDIVIYCIQPAEIRFAEELSPTVKRALPLLVQKVYNEVAEDLNR